MYTVSSTYRAEGKHLKKCEGINHLGNVLVTVTDNIRMDADSTWANVVSANDYFPFGLGMKGRGYASSKMRNQFNGKEQDPEIAGTGNSYDYGFRIYNPKIAKFLSVDPLTISYPELTPYQFASNTPIAAIDLDGLEALIVIHSKWYQREILKAKRANDIDRIRYLAIKSLNAPRPEGPKDGFAETMYSGNKTAGTFNGTFAGRPGGGLDIYGFDENGKGKLLFSFDTTPEINNEISNANKAGEPGSHRRGTALENILKKYSQKDINELADVFGDDLVDPTNKHTVEGADNGDGPKSKPVSSGYSSSEQIGDTVILRDQSVGVRRKDGAFNQIKKEADEKDLGKFKEVGSK